MDESVDRREAFEAIQAFRNGQAGVPFPALERFAAPIFDLYGKETLDPPESAPTHELVDCLSMMETARLFWVYFGSGSDRDSALTGRVKELLVGETPSLEQEAVFAALVEQLRSNWCSIPRSLRNGSATSSNPSALLQVLCELESGEHEPDASVGVDGTPDSAIDSPEALAAFASPLLEDPSLGDDPDRLSEMMQRARDYWHLAQLDGADFELHQRAIADRYSTSGDEREIILAEASFMVARFHMLFPHWTGPRTDV
jgi:hypothetical protein